MDNISAAIKAVFLLVFILAILVFLLGCSSGEPVCPAAGEIKASESAPTNRCLLGYYDCAIRPDGSIAAIPNREASAHYNVTNFLLPPNCNDCIGFKVLEFKPALEMLIVAVTLRNPTPTPGYDVRGILMSDSNPPHDIMNRDGYTTTWDNGGPVERNPFIRFSGDEPFEGYGTHTEIFYVLMPKPPSFQFAYAVDAGVPGHCREPYSLTGYIEAGLEPGGGSAEIVMFAGDWQDDVCSVTADTSMLNGSTTGLSYDSASGAWRNTISNSQGLPAGDYLLWVWAESANSGNMRIYQKIGFTVGPLPGLAGGWPVERCTPLGDGTSTASGPADGESKWTHAFSGVTWDESFNNSPIADSAGNIYMALPDRLAAIDINGDETWSFPANNAAQAFTPFLRGDDVIVWPVNRELSGYNLGFLYFVGADGSHASSPGMLPGLAVAPGVPNADGNIIIPIDNGIYACDKTGYGIWSYVPGDGEFTVPRPVAVDDNGAVAFITDYGGVDTEFISLSKQGVELWAVPLNGAPLCQAVYGANGGVYAASTAKDLSQLNKFGIQARDSSDGGPFWPGTHSNHKGLTNYALAASAEYIYATGNAGDLCYAVDASDGGYLYGYQPFGVLQDVISAASIDGTGRVYAGVRIKVASLEYSLFVGLDDELGYLWSFQEEGHGFISSPVIGAEGYVFCLGVSKTDALQLYCFGEK